MTQKVNVSATASTVTLSPLARFMRTVFQVVLAVAAAIPVIMNTPAVSGNAVLAKYLGVVSGFFITIVAILNALENYGIIPVIGGQPAIPLVTSVTATEAGDPLPKSVPSL